MPPTLHIQNARIWTGDPARPWAGSITIVGGRVQSLHEGPIPDSGGDSHFRTIDAAGRTITPGLIDAHMHLLMGGNVLEQLDLSKVRSREAFEAAIARRHAELPAGAWLIGSGWSQENWPGGGFPTRQWLVGAGHRPTVCYRMDMHAAVVNDAVLAMIDTSSDPPGGRIQRDSNGRPTGLLIEAALWQLVNPLVPKPDAAARRRHLLAAQSHAHAMGLTAVGAMEYAHDVRDVFAPMRDQLTLRCRITLLDRPRGSETIDLSFASAFPNDDRLAIIGCKTFIDGTLGSRTARMLRDYADDPGNRGLLVEAAAHDALNNWACLIASHGLSPSMHAIGDEAVRLALDAIDRIDAIAPNIRARIEHAQQIDANDFARFRFRGRGRIASMQPLHKADDCRYVRKRLGDERLAGTFAFRRLLNAGAVLAFGSDWPVVSCDPLLGIRTAVTGLTLDGEVFGVEQNLTVEEALRAYTRGAAYALGMDDAGVLKPGAVGDLVMFDRDPFTTDWMQTMPRIAMTIVGGEVVYDGSVVRQAEVPCPLFRTSTPLRPCAKNPGPTNENRN